jgi:hypothetical protein
LPGEKHVVASELLVGVVLGLACVAGAFGQPAKARPDLADIAAGVYDGDVISDARGSGGPASA